MNSINTETKFRSTREFAEANLVKAASVRSRYCLTGSYHGVTPVRLVNGRLGWPDLKPNEATGEVI